MMVNYGEEITDPKYNPRILEVLTHPDDEIFFGGTSYKASQNGCEVIGLLVTTGSAGYGDEHQKESIGKTRLNEIRKSVEILGIELKLLEDYLECTPEQATAVDRMVDSNNIYLQRGIISAIRDIGPTTVIVPYEKDGHKDHRNVFGVVKDAILSSESPSQPDLGNPHLIKRLFEYEIMNLMNNPTQWIDITGEPWEKVNDALLCHESQIEKDPAYLSRIALRTILRGGQMSSREEYSNAVKNVNELWKKQIENFGITPADRQLIQYIPHARRAEVLKASAVPKFW
jgi:LmbE family N-acetylglucosaminyl deacetylase